MTLLAEWVGINKGAKMISSNRGFTILEGLIVLVLLLTVGLVVIKETINIGR